jgi:hypothetical protein
VHLSYARAVRADDHAGYDAAITTSVKLQLDEINAARNTLPCALRALGHPPSNKAPAAEPGVRLERVDWPVLPGLPPPPPPGQRYGSQQQPLGAETWEPGTRFAMAYSFRRATPEVRGSV